MRIFRSVSIPLLLFFSARISTLNLICVDRLSYNIYRISSERVLQKLYISKATKTNNIIYGIYSVLTDQKSELKFQEKNRPIDRTFKIDESNIERILDPTIPFLIDDLDCLDTGSNTNEYEIQSYMRIMIAVGNYSYIKALIFHNIAYLIQVGENVSQWTGSDLSDKESSGLDISHYSYYFYLLPLFLIFGVFCLVDFCLNKLDEDIVLRQSFMVNYHIMEVFAVQINESKALAEKIKLADKMIEYFEKDLAEKKDSSEIEVICNF
ncbi:MAG: hypothetical protein MHMPM18_001002 [Marteilia pararefringens]